MSHKGSFGVGTDAVISFQFSLFISLRVATFTIFLERSNHLMCAYTFDNARSRIIQNIQIDGYTRTQCLRVRRSLESTKF